MKEFIVAGFTLLYVFVMGPVFHTLNHFANHGEDSDYVFLQALTIVAIAAVWYFYRKTTDASVLFARALSISFVLALLIIILPLLSKEWRLDKQREEMHVVYMTDEVLRSPKGNPIGIRLKYSMTFQDGTYSFHEVALIDNKNPNSFASYYQIRPDLEKYQTDGYFTVDYIPFIYYGETPSKTCVKDQTAIYSVQESMENNIPTNLTITVEHTNFGLYETDIYNFKELYEGSVNEGLPECNFGNS